MSSASLGPCIVCEKQDSPRCLRCNSAFYCSKTCQRIDWPVHGLLCGSFATFNASSRPTEEHFRTIVFLPNNKEPQFRWIHCKWLPISVSRHSRAYTFLVDGSARNKSVASIIATQQGDYHDWRGPITAYGKLGPEPSRLCRDLDMNDFRHIADYFLSYGHRLPQLTPPAQQVAAERVVFSMTILAVIVVAAVAILLCY
ncbi:hypothetical protein PG997_009231 [Apiospora hydei]|uniref:MYND-type domain-containing protein n=1 Tax=Apiospora hydei TaxID=1337664 RepID=A0ABR1VXN3_9PEZI